MPLFAAVSTWEVGAAVVPHAAGVDEHVINALFGLQLVQKIVTSSPKIVTSTPVRPYWASALATQTTLPISAPNDAIKTAIAKHVTLPFVVTPILGCGQVAASRAELELELANNVLSGRRLMLKTV